MVDFSWGKLAIWSYFRGWGGGGGGVGRGIVLYRHFSDGKFYYGKIVVIFFRGRGGELLRMRGGEWKLLSDRNISYSLTETLATL